MPLWTDSTPPKFKPNAVLTKRGWEENGVIIVAMNDKTGAAPAAPAEPQPVAITALVGGTEYTITTVGDSDFTLVGAADNNVGTVFTATGAGVGTGTATPTA